MVTTAFVIRHGQNARATWRGQPALNNGFEAARRMRRSRPSGILIALSGWGRDEDKQRSAEAGFNEHLINPVSPEDLRKVLKAFGATRPGGPRPR